MPTVVRRRIRHTALHAVGASVPECLNRASKLTSGDVCPSNDWIPAAARTRGNDISDALT